MKVTGNSNLNHRKLPKEGYLQKVSLEKKEYAGACVPQRMTETDITNAKQQTERLLEQILAPENNTRKGYWRTAHSQILLKTLAIERFKRAGYRVELIGKLIETRESKAIVLVNKLSQMSLSKARLAFFI